MDRIKFKFELISLINRHSMENASNTPDFLLADYLCRCLDNFDITVQQREAFYGRDPRPSIKVTTPDDLEAARKLTH